MQPTDPVSTESFPPIQHFFLLLYAFPKPIFSLITPNYLWYRYVGRETIIFFTFYQTVVAIFILVWWKGHGSNLLWILSNFFHELRADLIHKDSHKNPLTFCKLENGVIDSFQINGGVLLFQSGDFEWYGKITDNDRLFFYIKRMDEVERIWFK